MAIFGDLEPGEKYLYHYTNPSTLPLILASGQLRMGQYAKTNDPRETRQWMPSLVLDDGSDVSTEELFDLLHALDARVRVRAKLLCLTKDRSSLARDIPTEHHRGWARSRMWGPYGADHTGACLVFRQADLDRAVRDALAPTPVEGNNVRYADGPVGRAGYFSFRASAVRGAVGLDEAADALIDQQKIPLFFTKSVEWASELELRYLAHSDNEFDEVPIWGSLAAVVLGDLFDESAVPAMREMLDVAGSNALLAHCRWQNGLPSVVPAVTPT